MSSLQKKSLAVIGPRSSGKTTLINSIANHFFQRSYESDRLVAVSRSPRLSANKELSRFSFDGDVDAPKTSTDNPPSYLPSCSLENKKIRLELYESTGLDLDSTRSDGAEAEEVARQVAGFGEMDALIFVVSANDTRPKTKLRKFLEEFKPLITPGRSVQIFVAFTHVVNPLTVDCRKSIRKVGISLKRSLVFENDCLASSEELKNRMDSHYELYEQTARAFWDRNRSNYEQLISFLFSGSKTPQQVPAKEMDIMIPSYQYPETGQTSQVDFDSDSKFVTPYSEVREIEEALAKKTPTFENGSELFTVKEESEIGLSTFAVPKHFENSAEKLRRSLLVECLFDRAEAVERNLNLIAELCHRGSGSDPKEILLGPENGSDDNRFTKGIARFLGNFRRHREGRSADFPVIQCQVCKAICDTNRNTGLDFSSASEKNLDKILVFCKKIFVDDFTGVCLTCRHPLSAHCVTSQVERSECKFDNLTRGSTQGDSKSNRSTFDTDIEYLRSVNVRCVEEIHVVQCYLNESYQDIFWMFFDIYLEHQYLRSISKISSSDSRALCFLNELRLVKRNHCSVKYRGGGKGAEAAGENLRRGVLQSIELELKARIKGILSSSS